MEKKRSNRVLGQKGDILDALNSVLYLRFRSVRTIAVQSTSAKQVAFSGLRAAFKASEIEIAF
jgi:hypothetical protein